MDMRQCLKAAVALSKGNEPYGLACAGRNPNQLGERFPMPRMRAAATCADVSCVEQRNSELATGSSANECSLWSGSTLGLSPGAIEQFATRATLRLQDKPPPQISKPLAQTLRLSEQQVP